MDADDTRPPISAAPAATHTPLAAPAARPRRPWRHLAAGALAGGVLAAAVAVPVTLGIAHASAPDATPTTSSTGPGTVPAVLPGTSQQDQLEQLPDTWSGGGPGGFPGAQDTQDSQDEQSQATQGTSVETDATDAQSRGLVLIDTVLSGGEAAGTGMVLQADGLVLTNYHVVEGSTSIRVTVATTGATYDATVVGRDASADVAVLQLADASGLTTVDLDEEGDPAVASDVVAVGNAEGQGYLSAATGTVQALGRSITTEASGSVAGESLSDLIQTDAAVVGGYSGGALLDADGEVVGMTTAASTASSGQGGPAGLTAAVAESYAVPIDDALEVVAVIEAGADTATTQVGASPYLGVSIGQDLAVAEVEAGGPAADAGVDAGSTITGVDGTPVTTYDALSAVMATLEPGDTTALTWTGADGAEHRAEVALGSSPVN